jgi:hypothetical protein
MAVSAPRWSYALVAALIGLPVAALPTRAAAQGAGCTAHSCTAVQHVQVTVPTRLALSGAGPLATVNANTGWRLEVTSVESDRSQVTKIEDTPTTSAAVVRYTLVGA